MGHQCTDRGGACKPTSLQPLFITDELLSVVWQAKWARSRDIFGRPVNMTLKLFDHRINLKAKRCCGLP